MECLFPKESVCPDPEAHPPASFNADCCCAKNSDRGEFRSCNPLLAKATHKAMNRCRRTWMGWLRKNIWCWRRMKSRVVS